MNVQAEVAWRLHLATLQMAVIAYSFKRMSDEAKKTAYEIDNLVEAWYKLPRSLRGMIATK